MLEDFGHGPTWLQFLSALPSIHNLDKVRFACTCFISTIPYTFTRGFLVKDSESNSCSS